MVDEEEEEDFDEDGDLSGKLKDLDFRYNVQLAVIHERGRCDVKMIII